MYHPKYTDEVYMLYLASHECISLEREESELEYFDEDEEGNEIKLPAEEQEYRFIGDEGLWKSALTIEEVLDIAIKAQGYNV